MNSTKQITIAAILLFLSSAFGLILPILMPALIPEMVSLPYPALLLIVLPNGIGLVAAYGVWKNQRWGKILAIILSALNGLLALPGVFFAPSMTLWLIAIIGIAINIVVIVLLLWRTPKLAVA